MNFWLIIQGILIWYCILVVAILLNGVAWFLHLHTRYDVLHKGISSDMIAQLKNISLLSRCFLLVLYPLALGVTGRYATHLLSHTLP